MATVVVGVGGGIAAYKVPSLVRQFTETGHDVTVVPTAAALNFVGEATWAALSGNPVSTEVWDRVHEVNHVAVGQRADLVVIAPATADLIARAAVGRADDLLSATLLTATCPVLFAPAMHTEMWQHPATAANVATLRERGVTVMAPAIGRLTGSDSGPGRLPEPEEIYRSAIKLLGPQDLAGVRVVVSAGGTREPLDPVRFLGNRSSGRQGYALAAGAARRGANVVLVSANVALPAPTAVTVVSVETAAELAGAVQQHAASADIVTMAAAVADFRPADVSDVKLKKDSAVEPTAIALERNPDILRALVANKSEGQTIVGFAAETGDEAAAVIEYGRKKLAAKGCDLLVVNDVSGGAVFERAENQVIILDRVGGQQSLPRADKSRIADQVWDAVIAFRRSAP
ncbi:MAG: bifunctional phosphopantothenoylcysteine decarboxylase/phosphopantothenate--cysteine ligase CoaBC [Actinomycetia bacterium]|nr:bifunctional phosphopantothenoylcysteine decarboxylase/phosphopantothenate--cysteine ligase CoaBC [Actinomycetes bacterium]